MQNVTRFEIERQSFIRYQIFGNTVGTVVLGLLFAVLPILIGLDQEAGAGFYFITAIIIGAGMLFSIQFGYWYAPRVADSRKYWIEGDLLRVNQGVFNIKQTSVPLDRVTDIVVTQGVLLRAYGLWTIRVQTAGDTVGMAEATMQGIGDPEVIRVALLDARRALQQK